MHTTQAVGGSAKKLSTHSQMIFFFFCKFVQFHLAYMDNIEFLLTKSTNKGT